MSKCKRVPSIGFSSLSPFFSILIFAMVGCGSAENVPPGNPDSDMMVINPDAGVDMMMMGDDMGTIDEGMDDAGTDSDATPDDDDMGTMMADECELNTDDCDDVNATCTDTDDSYVCECNTGFEGNGVTCTDIDGCAGDPCGFGESCADVPAPGVGFTCTLVEDLYFVWIPERVTGTTNAERLERAQSICDDHDGFLIESLASDPPNFRDISFPSNANALHPFPPMRACGLITNEITSCEFYKSRAEDYCHQQTWHYCNNYPCGGLFETQEMRYDRCLNGDMVSMPHPDMVSYATCEEDCQEDLEWQHVYNFDSRAEMAFWTNASSPYNTLFRGLNTSEAYPGTVNNVICVVPESSIPEMPEGVSGEYPRILYMEAAQ